MDGERCVGDTLSVDGNDQLVIVGNSLSVGQGIDTRITRLIMDDGRFFATELKVRAPSENRLVVANRDGIEVRIVGLDSEGGVVSGVGVGASSVGSINAVRRIKRSWIHR